MDNVNAKFATELLFEDPETKEELRLEMPPVDNGDASYTLYVSNESGSRKWQHIIKTAER